MSLSESGPGALNPLQPLMNKLSQVVCALEKIANMKGGGLAITISEQRTDKARHGTFVVESTAKPIFTANPKRLNISIVNSTPQTVFVGFDVTVTDDSGSNMGYELLSGGTFQDKNYTGEIWVIVAVGTSKVSYIEEGL
jgi:hypothetical protein